MTEVTQGSDMATGLALLFGLVVVLAAIATAATASLSVVADNGDTMQLMSGVAMAVAMLAAGIAVTAIHVFD